MSDGEFFLPQIPDGGIFGNIFELSAVGPENELLINITLTGHVQYIDHLYPLNLSGLYCQFSELSNSKFELSTEWD